MDKVVSGVAAKTGYTGNT